MTDIYQSRYTSFKSKYTFADLCMQILDWFWLSEDIQIKKKDTNLEIWMATYRSKYAFINNISTQRSENYQHFRTIVTHCSFHIYILHLPHDASENSSGVSAACWQVNHGGYSASYAISHYTTMQIVILRGAFFFFLQKYHNFTIRCQDQETTWTQTVSERTLVEYCK